MNPLEGYLNHVPSPIWSHLSHIESFLLAFLASIYIFKPHQKKKKSLNFVFFLYNAPTLALSSSHFHVLSASLTTLKSNPHLLLQLQTQISSWRLDISICMSQGLFSSTYFNPFKSALPLLF